MNTNRPRAAGKVAALLLTIACVALAAWAVGVRVSRAQVAEEARESKPPPPSAGAIYGRAVNEATGKPLRRARISLMTIDGSRVDEGALTDARGEFRIGKLPAGRYVVWAEVNGMLTPAALANGLGDVPFDPEEIRRHFEVVELDGKAEREVTVRARRGGSITGRVTYADGDPAIGVLVYLLRRVEGIRPLRPTGPSGEHAAVPRTDDRGVYRVAGLPPGEYLVAVTEAADHKGTGVTRGALADMPGMSDLVFDQQLLTTYHPSASSTKGAEAVNVRAGEEQADVHVTIPDRELRTIAGLVRAARGGRPLKGVQVSIVPKNEDDSAERAFFDVTGGAEADADGRWRLREIPDGLYTIHVKPADEHEGEESAETSAQSQARNMNSISDTDGPVGGTTRRRRRFAPLRRELRVSGDVSELVIELGEGARVSGQLVFESGKTPSYPYIFAMPVAKTFAEAINGGPATAEINADSFVLEGLAPGKYFLHARDFSEQGGLYVKALTWQGRDLRREPLEVGEGTEIEGVRVVYGNDPGVLNVRVSRADKQPGYNVNVFLLPPDMSRWSVYAPQLSCSTGSEGSCRISAPPGDYLVVIVPLEDITRGPEEELRRRALNAPRLTLRPNEQKSLETVIKEETKK